MTPVLVVQRWDGVTVCSDAVTMTPFLVVQRWDGVTVCSDAVTMTPVLVVQRWDGVTVCSGAVTMTPFLVVQRWDGVTVCSDAVTVASPVLGSACDESLWRQLCACGKESCSRWMCLYDVNVTTRWALRLRMTW
jgi:hypothetical protein